MLDISTNNVNDPLQDLLNPSQYAAVTYCDGPSIIVAGAGSGKTRVLTYKIAYLLQHGWHPSQILALTFTNKAADEMKERIATIVGEKTARWLWMGTFHSIFSKILRVEAERIGYTSTFTIYDQADSKNLVKSIIKELQLDEKIYKPGAIQGRISAAKNNLILPYIYERDAEFINNDRNSLIPCFIDIYKTYCERCRLANAMDFDDLLVNTNRLFDRNPDVLARYQQRFGYILVDEYQDTNLVQHTIISKLAATHQHICVVGDDAQSIYSFRGANIDNILQFQNQYVGCKLFKLEQNYRSTQTIVNAANTLIAKNRNQIRKNVFSEDEVGKRIAVISAYTDYDEAYAVADNMSKSLQATNDAYSDYAILYRTNAQSRTMEEALRKRNIPYKVYGGLSFYQRKEVKDVLAYLRLIINPSDEESFKRVVNYPARGIGETTQGKVLNYAHEHQISAVELLQHLDEHTLDVNKGTHTKLSNFGQMITSFQQLNEESTAIEVAKVVIGVSGIEKELLEDRSLEGIARKENVDELMNAINQFCEEHANNGDVELKLVDFLSEVSLLTDQDNEKEEDFNRVTLMTVHSAKGLEFKHVYIAGLEENLFPSSMCETERDLEEERRLLYVAITRAKKECTISYAKSRFRNGQTQFSNPSRFLYDIDAKYLLSDKPIGYGAADVEVEQISQPRFSGFGTRLNPRNPSQNASPFAKKYAQPQVQSLPQHNPRFTKFVPTAEGRNMTFPYEVGMCVEHNIFGKGTIQKIEGEGDATKATIEFETNGVKPLLLKYAKLKIIEQ